jgi:hypothetical protein
LHRKAQRGYQGCIGDIDFVMIGKQRDPDQPLANEAEDDSIFKTAVMGKMSVDEINLIQDYIAEREEANIGAALAATIEEPVACRPRASTMEEFEKFQGETSKDPPMAQRQLMDSEAVKEAKRISEESQSFITLLPGKVHSINTLGSLYDTFSVYTDPFTFQGERFE